MAERARSLLEAGLACPVPQAADGAGARTVRRMPLVLGGRLCAGNRLFPGRRPVPAGLSPHGAAAAAGGIRPARSRGLRLGGCLLPLLRDGRWLPGRALLLLCDHHQQVLAHRLRQHRLLYPRRRPWRISRTRHAAWQRRNTVVLCHLSHPPRRMTMLASDSATYRNYRFDPNSTLSSSLYGLYVYRLVPVSAMLASQGRVRVSEAVPRRNATSASRSPSMRQF